MIEMNSRPESWSLPWHALQRRLAEAFSVNGKLAVSAQQALYNSSNGAGSTASWLVKARVAAACASAPGW